MTHVFLCVLFFGLMEPAAAAKLQLSVLVSSRVDRETRHLLKGYRVNTSREECMDNKLSRSTLPMYTLV